ncbi:hypothetical protein DF185_06625 [Marinifilum breve]|uniref:Uncharacterized protein n=1 Tax=Marinifilum breve TaxID=2184082 RepID=A0A2V4A351_9BACT|nr:hypothetical protein DF185_06625 [Marinifilum breve]
MIALVTHYKSYRTAFNKQNKHWEVFFLMLFFNPHFNMIVIFLVNACQKWLFEKDLIGKIG